MKVSYSRVFGLGAYENEKIAFEDEVLITETAEQAFDRVKAWVHARHGETVDLRSHEKQLERIQEKIYQAKYGLVEVMNQWRSAVQHHDELRELLAKNGLNINPLMSYYLPPEDDQVDEDVDEDDE